MWSSKLFLFTVIILLWLFRWHKSWKVKVLNRTRTEVQIVKLSEDKSLLWPEEKDFITHSIKVARVSCMFPETQFPQRSMKRVRLQSMGLQRVKQDWWLILSLFIVFSGTKYYFGLMKVLNNNFWIYEKMKVRSSSLQSELYLYLDRLKYVFLM